MKTIQLAKRWRHRVNDTTVEEYAAGSTATVSDARAEAAQRAGVLKGDPVDAVEPETGDAGAAGGKKAKG